MDSHMLSCLKLYLIADVIVHLGLSWGAVSCATAWRNCGEAQNMHGHGCENQGGLPVYVCHVALILRHWFDAYGVDIQELGYPGDCGYNQLLYPTEDSMRDILNWLMNKLPRSEVAA